LPITARLPRLVAVDAAVCHRAESLDLVDIGSCQGNHGRNEEGKAMVRSFGRRNIILLRTLRPTLGLALSSGPNALVFDLDEAS
jgi:hypothetical protein